MRMRLRKWASRCHLNLSARRQRFTASPDQLIIFPRSHCSQLMDLSQWLLTILGVLDSGTLQGLVFFGLALSVVLSLLTLNYPDLSIEGTFPLGAAIAAVMLRQHISPILVLAAAAGA